MAPKDLKTLLLLDETGSGLYGSELVARSNGFVGRGTVYTLLARLVAKKFVREVAKPATAALQIDRTRYLITPVGRKALRAFLDLMGLQRKT